MKSGKYKRNGLVFKNKTIEYPILSINKNQNIKSSFKYLSMYIIQSLTFNIILNMYYLYYIYIYDACSEKTFNLFFFFYDSMKNYHQPFSTQCSKYVDLVNWCMGYALGCYGRNKAPSQKVTLRYLRKRGQKQPVARLKPNISHLSLPDSFS